ncbi:LOW QUALITY PROTEIN: hypothetical protein BC938DRAFT_481807 [Jimgerdemannia flammicorona]|uniref:Uncharacterized protein n=1 Tax=Jimgerdemannia flammicorona TaxID=994334 RepID=A0A433QFB3_9FUNG|nr:LOW QUALITY PROTEIN: hypothetical protein BC938DRAFT_481807 [Jimgerdemannia flammicorona]
MVRSSNYFIKRYGARKVNVIDCEDGTVVPSTVENFFGVLENVSKRDKHANGRYEVSELKVGWDGGGGCGWVMDMHLLRNVNV